MGVHEFASRCTPPLKSGVHAADKVAGMVTWSVTEAQVSEAPTFSLTGTVVAWADGTPGLVRQTAFLWFQDAWCASFVVTRIGGSAPLYGVIRIPQPVSELWRRRQLNPLREAEAQLRAALLSKGWRPDFGVLTLQPAAEH